MWPAGSIFVAPNGTYYTTEGAGTRSDDGQTCTFNIKVANPERLIQLNIISAAAVEADGGVVVDDPPIQKTVEMNKMGWMVVFAPNLDPSVDLATHNFINPIVPRRLGTNITVAAATVRVFVIFGFFLFVVKLTLP